MKKLIFLTLAVVLTVILFSCKSDTVTNSTGINSPDTSSFKYPLKQGSTWSFTRTISVKDIHPDSILHYFSNYPLVSTGTISVLYDTVINGINTTCLMETYISETYSSGTYTSVSRHYVINTDTAFIEYAERGLPYFVTFLRAEHNRNFHVNADNISSPDEDIHIFDPPFEIMKYPVSTGMEWTAYKNAGLIRIISKRYTGWQQLRIQGQLINCMETRCFLNIVPETPYYAYYSKYGLLKQNVFFDDMLVASQWYPEGVGTADITDITTVNSFNVR